MLWSLGRGIRMALRTEGRTEDGMLGRCGKWPALGVQHEALAAAVQPIVMQLNGCNRPGMREQESQGGSQ